MHRSRSRWDDDALERVVGRLLQGGVMLAASVTVIGGILYLVRRGTAPVDVRTLASSASVVMLRDIGRGIRAGRGDAVVLVGLLILVATPVARVALLVVAFLAERDWMYVAVSTVVLAVLLASLLFGR